MVRPGVAPATNRKRFRAWRGEAAYIPAKPDWWPPTKRPKATQGGLIAASVACLSRQEGVLAHVPCFGQNPRGSPDFLAYPVPKACMHVLGTRVPRRLGVARSASSPNNSRSHPSSLLKARFCFCEPAGHSYTRLP